ncbi:MAG: histidine phosphatase family protein, partial [Bifidobacteriaceae bacterium]|nr:histidine phosphatase family protein [Bifidobacteriaceae bacterium]
MTSTMQPNQNLANHPNIVVEDGRFVIAPSKALEQCVHSVIFVRHGRTSYNAEHRFQGHTDIPLDSVGRWQVQQTAQDLQNLYVKNSSRKQVVVSSDLGRAQETAHAFADSLQLEVHLDERVKERNFGAWEGQTLAHLQQEYPEDFLSWMNHQGGELRYGAEPKTHVGERGMQAVQDWGSRFDNNTDLFVFSHGAWISQTIQTLLLMPNVDSDFVGLIS